MRLPVNPEIVVGSSSVVGFWPVYAGGVTTASMFSSRDPADIAFPVDELPSLGKSPARPNAADGDIYSSRAATSSAPTAGRRLFLRAVKVTPPMSCRWISVSIPGANGDDPCSSAVISE
jgi:hypothetical protein